MGNRIRNPYRDEEPELIQGNRKSHRRRKRASDRTYRIRRKVIQETRRWDDNKESSHAMRSKEDAQDYRYFPEPDLVPIVIDDEWIEKIKARQPEFRDEKLERYKKEFDIPEYDAEILTGPSIWQTSLKRQLQFGNKPKKVSNWLMVETHASVKRTWHGTGRYQLLTG